MNIKGWKTKECKKFSADAGHVKITKTAYIRNDGLCLLGTTIGRNSTVWSIYEGWEFEFDWAGQIVLYSLTPAELEKIQRAGFSTYIIEEIKKERQKISNNKEDLQELPFV